MADASPGARRGGLRRSSQSRSHNPPPSVPAKVAAPTVLRAAANAANAAVPAPAPAAAGMAEARTAVDVVPPSPVTAEVEVEAAVHPPSRKSQPRKSSEPRRTRLMQHQDLTGTTVGAARRSGMAAELPERAQRQQQINATRAAAAADQRVAGSGRRSTPRRRSGTAVGSSERAQRQWHRAAGGGGSVASPEHTQRQRQIAAPRCRD